MVQQEVPAVVRCSPNDAYRLQDSHLQETYPNYREVDLVEKFLHMYISEVSFVKIMEHEEILGEDTSIYMIYVEIFIIEEFLHIFCRSCRMSCEKFPKPSRETSLLLTETSCVSIIFLLFISSQHELHADVNFYSQKHLVLA